MVPKVLILEKAIDRFRKKVREMLARMVENLGCLYPIEVA
jgi:hypothetical protein